MTALRHSTPAALLVLPLALLLAGCTGTGVIESAPTAASTRPESTTPAPVQAEPAVRIDLGCADLVDPAELRVGTGSAVASVSPVVAPTTTLESVAVRQFGALECAWSTGPLELDRAVPLVSVVVTPEVAPERWREFVSVIADDATQSGAHGQDSYVTCAPARFEGSTCQLDNLVDGRWLSMLVTSTDSSATLESTAPVFATATAAVRAITRADGSRWVAPETSTLDPAFVSAALVGPAFEAGIQTITPQFGARWLAAGETGMTGVVYSAPTLVDGSAVDFEIQVLPAGGWAFAALQAAAGDGSGSSDVGDAAVAYPSPDGTVVVFTLGDDLVLLDVYSAGLSEQADRSTAVAAARAVASALG